MDPLLAAIAERRVAEVSGEDLVSIQRGDIGGPDLGDASLVFAFLPVRVLQSMLRSTLDRMPPGSKPVAHEQEEADFPPDADTSHLVVTDTGLTAAHVWLV